MTTEPPGGAPASTRQDACGPQDPRSPGARGDWEVLLADLESRFEAERRAGLAAQGADLAEAERTSVALLDRIRGAVGRRVRLRTRTGLPVDGVLARVVGDVLAVDEGAGAQALVPAGAVAVAGPLPGPAPAPGPYGPTGRQVLRELARRGQRVRLLLTSGEVVGWLLRVGKDHLDVAVEAQGLAAGPGAGAGGRLVLSVALSAIEVVRSR